MESTFHDVREVFTHMARRVGYFDFSALDTLRNTTPTFVDAAPKFQPLIDLYDNRALHNPQLGLPAEAGEWLMRAVAWHCNGTAPTLFDLPSVAAPPHLENLFATGAATNSPDVVHDIHQLLVDYLTSTTMSPGVAAQHIWQLSYNATTAPLAAPMNDALQNMPLDLPTAIKLSEVFHRVFQFGHGTRNRFHRHLYLAWAATQNDPHNAADLLYQHLSPYQLSGVTDTIWHIWLASIASKKLSLQDESFIRFFDQRQGYVYHALHGFFERSVQHKPELAALAMLPAAHQRLMSSWSREALYNPDSHVRDMCMTAVATFNDRTLVIREALTSPKLHLRIQAAQWATTAPHTDLVDDLMAAYRAERNPKARSVLLAAVEAQGVDLQKILTVHDILGFAERKQKLPATATWLDSLAYPTLVWQNDGNTVPTTVLRWLIRTAVDEENGAAGSILRFAAKLCAPEGIQELAELVFDQWVAHDIARWGFDEITEEANRFACEQLDQHAQWLPTTSFVPGTPEYEEEKAHLIRRKVAELVGTPQSSAVDARGVLGIASLAVSDSMVATAKDYIAQWPTRRTQCVALLHMLAASSNTTAHDAVIHLSTQTQHAAIQQDAIRCLPLLSQQLGLSAEQIEDIRVPRFGFDTSSQKKYSVGGTTYTAFIRHDFSLGFINPSGQPATSVSFVDAHSELVHVRRELSTLRPVVVSRLRDAMVVGRTWTMQQWWQHIAEHPVTRQVAMGLVWCDDASATLFRLTPDGTLCDVAGEPVSLNEGPIRLAFTPNVEAVHGAAWLQCFADHNVPWSFQQFDHRLPAVEEFTTDMTRLEEFEGFLVDGVVFTEHAAALGYACGPAEEDAMHFDWHHVYESLGLVATLTCSGVHHVPEPQRVALHHMTFSRVEAQNVLLPVVDVPRGVLVQTWHDLVEFAEAGSGFHAQWSTQVP